MRIKFVKSFIKNNFKFYLSLVICSAICFSCFVTFYHLLTSLDNGLNNYVKDYDYTDVIINLKENFTEEEKLLFKNVEGIDLNYTTYYDEFKSNEFSTIRLLSINFDKFPTYKEDELEDGDIYLSIDYAKANNIKMGDYINLDIDNEIVPVKVKALVNSPYLLGLTRSNLSLLETSTYGIAAIDSRSNSSLLTKLKKSSVAYSYKDGVDKDKVDKEVEDIFKDKIENIFSNKERLAIKTIENDINTLKPIATILPIIIYIIGLIISVLFVKQFIDIKKKEIGILKSLGLDNKYIISIFILYIFSITILSFIIGLILSIIQIRIYVNLYTNAVYLPIFKVNNNYFIILLGFIITFLTNILAIIINIKNIKKTDIISVINNIKSSNIKKINILKNRFIMIKPFIASITNNLHRFIFSIINLVFIIIIVTASVTVKDAKDESINYAYNKINNYDYIIRLKSDIVNNNDNSFYETIVNIYNNNDIYYANLTVLNNLNYINIYDLSDNKLKLSDDGVIISEKYANDLNINIGDYININNKYVKVINISKQTYNFRIFISYNLFNKLYGLNISNSLFTNNDNIINKDNVSYISSNEIMKNDINNKFSYIDNYIIIIICIVIFISIVVIFNISIIYYKENEDTNMILRTLGYSKKRIILSSTIELVIQGIVALIIGIPLGYYLAKYITNKIGNEYFMIYCSFRNVPVIRICIFIIITSIIGRIIASYKKIKLVDRG